MCVQLILDLGSFNRNEGWAETKAKAGEGKAKKGRFLDGIGSRGSYPCDPMQCFQIRARWPLLLWSFWPLRDFPFKSFEQIDKIIIATPTNTSSLRPPDISTNEVQFCHKVFLQNQIRFPFSSLEPFSDFKNVQVYFRSDANRIHRHGSLFTVQSVATDWRRDFPTQWDPVEWKERWRRQLCSRSWKTSKTSGKTQLVLGCSLTIHNLCREQTRISSVSNLSKFILLWIQTLQKVNCQKLLHGYPY